MKTLKKIFKKLFPKYKTKAQLKKEIAFLEGTHYSPVYTIERDVIRLSATIPTDERCIPTEYLKEQLGRKLGEQLEPFIEYDFEDSHTTPYKVIIGTVYIANKK